MLITVDKVSHGALSTFIWRDETVSRIDFSKWRRNFIRTQRKWIAWEKIDSQSQDGKYYEFRFSFARIHLICNMLRRVLQSSFHWVSTCNSFTPRNSVDCDFWWEVQWIQLMLMNTRIEEVKIKWNAVLDAILKTHVKVAKQWRVSHVTVASVCQSSGWFNDFKWMCSRIIHWMQRNKMAEILLAQRVGESMANGLF